MRLTLTVAVACGLLGLHFDEARAGACTGEIENLTKTLAATDAGSGPTGGIAANPQARTGDTAQHPPTGRMSQETQGRATSAEDVRRQTEGQPTAAEQSSGKSAGSPNKAEASAALDRARGFDRDGKEAECMNAVREARRLAGS